MRRVLLDQGMPVRAASMLRALGWDAVHVREIGMHKSEDLEILAHALAERRVVETATRPGYLSNSSGGKLRAFIGEVGCSELERLTNIVWWDGNSTDQDASGGRVRLQGKQRDTPAAHLIPTPRCSLVMSPPFP